jgi:hypothetical protein
MIDTELIVAGLRKRGHTVEHVIKVPENAGEYEFMVDGNLLTLADARVLLEEPPPRKTAAPVEP